eukprot:CAMPEP_0181507174 /NCGR_PEP_ID=MMETSP1110-20121109/59000_1 /TAXON_ID=174948 /ORGANISM="Symbiodinium sp., Strain CCMP421" /LENGTH=230 /DNA_ID=CAMNT_0023636307 /DNA_START=50 /DNA_END=742 /DNA_ORIENTATION=+
MSRLCLALVAYVASGHDAQPLANITSANLTKASGNVSKSLRGSDAKAKWYGGGGSPDWTGGGSGGSGWTGGGSGWTGGGSGGSGGSGWTGGGSGGSGWTGGGSGGSGGSGYPGSGGSGWGGNGGGSGWNGGGGSGSSWGWGHGVPGETCCMCSRLNNGKTWLYAAGDYSHAYGSQTAHQHCDQVCSLQCQFKGGHKFGCYEEQQLQMLSQQYSNQNDFTILHEDHFGSIC